VLENIVDLPDSREFVRVTIRLLTAAVLAGLVGAERQRVGKAAGLRTHMMAGLGAAVFVLAAVEMGMGEGDFGRVIQGVATGIGFIGAGTILKPSDGQGEVQGLTTAATIWLTAGIGASAGAGLLWLAVLTSAVALVILSVLTRAERWLGAPRDPR
jgi:putative Mg2+ transporter-C (MgtC) family protein